MFDEFTYREFHIRTGVRQSRTGGGRWYGTVSLTHDSLEATLSLADCLFDWPAAARRHAARYARKLIDARLDGREHTREKGQPQHPDSPQAA